MKYRSFILLPFIPLASGAFAQRSDKPNIIFFLMDDMGRGDIGINGQLKIETPNIDALASESKLFTDHYSGSPVSAPSRCVLLTGLHSGHADIRGNDEMEQRQGNVWSYKAMFEDPSLEGQKPLEKNSITIAHKLQEAGYTTACIGKWGLGGPTTDGTANKMGFDYFFGYNCQRVSHNYYPKYLYRNNERILLNNEIVEQNTPLDEGADPLLDSSYAKYIGNDYAPAMMFDKTIEFIDSNKDNPFFIWWTTPMPHAPMSAPKRLVDKYIAKFGDEKPSVRNGYVPVKNPHATYAAMVEYLDEQVGEIIAKLKKEGIYQNTIIVFTSDNGPSSEGGGDCQYFNSAAPFKNDAGWTKGSLHEGGIRVPLIVKWTGVAEAGSRSNHICSFQDWMPTLCQIAQVEAPKTDGISFVDELKGGKQKQHEFLYWEFPQNGGSIAVRKGDWKVLVKNLNKEPQTFLYNLSNDPTETTNLAPDNSVIVNNLLKLAHQSHIDSKNPNFKITLDQCL